MVQLLKDNSLVASWQNFFEENYKSEIETVALEYPEKRSLIVDYWDIDRIDPKLAEELINQPYKTIFNAEEALKNIDVAVENKIILHFRVTNLPDLHKIIIRKIRANHLGKLKAIEGLVPEKIQWRNDKSGATIPTVFMRTINDQNRISEIINKAKSNKTIKRYIDLDKYEQWFHKLCKRSEETQKYINPGAFYNYLKLILFIEKNPKLFKKT